MLLCSSGFPRQLGLGLVCVIGMGLVCAIELAVRPAEEARRGERRNAKAGGACRWSGMREGNNLMPFSHRSFSWLVVASGQWPVGTVLVYLYSHTMMIVKPYRTFLLPLYSFLLDNIT